MLCKTFKFWRFWFRIAPPSHKVRHKVLLLCFHLRAKKIRRTINCLCKNNIDRIFWILLDHFNINLLFFFSRVICVIRSKYFLSWYRVISRQHWRHPNSIHTNPTHYLMESDFSDYGSDLTVLCSNVTKKLKKIGPQTWKLLFGEYFKAINMTKIAIKQIFVCKRFSQIIVMQ